MRNNKQWRASPPCSALGLWYAFNAAFNVQNKVILNKFTFRGGVRSNWPAAFYFSCRPGLRSYEARRTSTRKTHFTILTDRALHCGGHGLQVSSMGAGSVFFTHVIKATEPVVGMLVLLAFTGKIAPPGGSTRVAPIVGVVYAGIKPGTAFGMGDLLGYASVAALASTVASLLPNS